jgi:hypothetical protein
MKEFVAIQIDFYGKICVTKTEAESWEDALWKVERSDCTSIVLTMEKARYLLRSLSEILKPENSN